jgi:hypothetical protein
MTEPTEPTWPDPADDPETEPNEDWARRRDDDEEEGDNGAS